MSLTLSHDLDVGSRGFIVLSHFSAATPAALISSHHLLSLPLFYTPPLLSCLDNITAYYFSYFHPSLCPYRPVSQAVMCDLELSLQLWASSVGAPWLVYWDVTGGVTLNKPTSPSSPLPPHPQTPLCSLHNQETLVGAMVGWQSVCARRDVANDHLRVPSSISGGGFGVCAALGACMQVCVCVCVFLNVCILILSANQLLSRGADSCRHHSLLSPRHRSFSSSSSIPPLSWQGGVRGESQPWVLLPRGVITALWDSLSHTHVENNTQLVSSVSFYPSLCHYSLQLSLWPSFRGFDAHSCTHKHTHTHSSNPNVPSVFVITLFPDGTRPIGFFIY